MGGTPTIQPPPGYTLDASPTSAPSSQITPPPGYTLDAPVETPAVPATKEVPLGARVVQPSDLGDIVTGAGKRLLQTTSGIGEMIHKIPVVGPTVIPEAGLQAEEQIAKPTSTAQQLGGLMEQGAEFALPEAGLRELGGLAKVHAMAPELIQLIEDYPKASRLILGALRGGAAGGAQAGIEAAAKQEPVKPAITGGAAGAAVGAAVPELIPGAAKLVRELMGYGLPEDEAANMVSNAAKFQPALGVTHEDVLKHAAEEGIKLTPAQATQQPAARIVQAVGERSVLGAKKLANALDEQSATFMNSVDRFANRLDPNAVGDSADNAGKFIKSAVEDAKDAKWQNAKAGYLPIDTQFPDAKVDTSNIQADWTKDKTAMQVVLDNAPASVRSKLQEVLGRGAELGTPTKEGVAPELPFSDALKLRSFFFDMGQTQSPDIPSRYQALYTKLAHDLDSAMETTAKDQNFESQWRNANAGWKDYVSKYGDKQSPLYQILKQDDPEKITRQLLNRRSPRDIDILQSEGLTDGLNALKHQVIDDVTNQHFRIGKNGLGGYSDAFLNKLLGPEDTKELYLKAEIGRRFKWQMNPSGTSNVLLGEQQLVHPTPNILAIPMGAAKASMPRPAESYLVPSGKISEPITKVVSPITGTAGEKAGESWVRMHDPRSGKDIEIYHEDVPKAEQKGLTRVQ